MDIEPDPNAERPWRRPQPWRYFWLLMILGVVGWQATISIRGCWRSSKYPDHVSDFTAFYGAGKLALRGQNIYDFKNSGVSRRPYLYPPTFAVVPMMILALLPHNAAAIVFTLINYLLLFGTFWLMRDALWRTAPKGSPPDHFTGEFWDWLLHPDSGLMLAAVVCFRFVHSNMRHGNSNLYVTFGLALALWWMLRNAKPLWEFSSGMAIALATAVKVTPGLFGLYLLWSWRKWGMVGGAVGLLFFLLIVPAVPMGFSGALARLKEYKAHMETATTGEDAEDDPIGHDGGLGQKQVEGGICIRGATMRYLTYQPMRVTPPGKSELVFSVNVASLPEETARWISRGIELALLLLTIALTVRSVARTDPGGLALSWGVIATAMVLISPLTRKAHLCVLLIPAIALIALMQQNRIRGSARILCIASMAAICFQGAIFSVNFIGKINSDWVQYLGVGFWTIVAFFIAAAWSLWKLEPRTAGVPPARI